MVQQSGYLFDRPQAHAGYRMSHGLLQFRRERSWTRAWLTSDKEVPRHLIIPPTWCLHRRKATDFLEEIIIQFIDGDNPVPIKVCLTCFKSMNEDLGEKKRRSLSLIVYLLPFKGIFHGAGGGEHNVATTRKAIRNVATAHRASVPRANAAV